MLFRSNKNTNEVVTNEEFFANACSKIVVTIGDSKNEVTFTVQSSALDGKFAVYFNPDQVTIQDAAGTTTYTESPAFVAGEKIKIAPKDGYKDAVAKKANGTLVEIETGALKAALDADIWVTVSEKTAADKDAEAVAAAKTAITALTLSDFGTGNKKADITAEKVLANVEKQVNDKLASADGAEGVTAVVALKTGESVVAPNTVYDATDADNTSKSVTYTITLTKGEASAEGGAIEKTIKIYWTVTDDKATENRITAAIEDAVAQEYSVAEYKSWVSFKAAITEELNKIEGITDDGVTITCTPDFDDPDTNALWEAGRSVTLTIKYKFTTSAGADSSEVTVTAGFGLTA